MSKPEAVIADMDGTLVNVLSLRHLVMGPKKNFDRFHSEAVFCPPNQQAIDWCAHHHGRGRTVLVVTARMYKHEEGSQVWLDSNMPCMFQGPYMRGDTDLRPDYEVKRDIFDILSERYTITHAIDDNPNVIRLWNELGLKVTEVPGWDHEVAASYIEQANKEK